MTWYSNHYKNHWNELEDFYQSNLENMKTKFSWSALFASKTVWFNILMTFLGVISALQGLSTFAKYGELLGLATVIGNVILKIWFNTTAIASTPSSK